MTPWTRIEGSYLWLAAEAAHAVPAGRQYHNMDHVRRLYFHAAETFGLRYCPDLDKAILCHDVVIDGAPEEVRRSAEWLEAHDMASPLSLSLIMGTEKHIPCEDNRLIILDLADFMFEDVSARNTSLLQAEAAALKGIDATCFMEGTNRYLRGLSSRVASGILVAGSGWEREAFGRIRTGIEQVIERLDRMLETGEPDAAVEPGP